MVVDIGILIWGCIKTNLAIFGRMNIHLPVIWGSLGYQGFDSYPFQQCFFDPCYASAFLVNSIETSRPFSTRACGSRPATSPLSFGKRIPAFQAIPSAVLGWRIWELSLKTYCEIQVKYGSICSPNCVGSSVGMAGGAPIVPKICLNMGDTTKRQVRWKTRLLNHRMFWFQTK